MRAKIQHKGRASVLLSTHAQDTILLDAYQRQQIEACGALLGKIDNAGNWHVEEARPLHNIAGSPVYFEFEPEELLSIELEQPGRMIGVYHSHPLGPTRASSTDQHNMRRVNREQHIPWVWLIVSGPFTNEVGEGSTISTQGVVAYHHYQDKGLQQITIQYNESAAIKPV
ncbi:MAG: Mov34/MPN/PAD-1 family protein [Ktedonobacteraceae bacterium]